MRRLLEITIQAVTCLTTSKRHAEPTDMKTFTPPIGRMGCLLSGIRTGPVPRQAFASHSSTKLSFPKCISPPWKVSLGIMGYLRRIKMFLTDWPLHLLPGVTVRIFFLLLFYLRVLAKSTRKISSFDRADSFTSFEVFSIDMFALNLSPA